MDFLEFVKPISIHALREESDKDTVDQMLMSGISIHALREESDLTWYA